ncbi:MAG: hypothetical protein LC753_09905, partial [Acidobacteria bacterium]|nr:hypothetical protein [Acidobacteriota bacterium]
MIRAVSASLEPERVADAILVRAAEWVPVPAWLVVAVDGTGTARLMAARGLTEPIDAAARAVGGWVIRTGEVFCSGDIGADRRIAGADGAAAATVAFPLHCRGRTVGALVALD